MRRGIELPVNVLVIVALAVIILIALVGLIGLGILGAKPIDIQLAKNTACGALINRGCPETSTKDIPTKVDVTGDGVNDDLQVLCEEEFGVGPRDEVACKRLCACPGL